MVCFEKKMIMSKIVAIFLIAVLFYPQWISAENPTKDSLEDEAATLLIKALKLRDEGKFEEALPYAEKAIKTREKALGSEHPFVAGSLSFLATLYANTNRLKEAELLYLKALEIQKKTYGSEHINVAMILNDMGWLYLKMGRNAEAETLLKRTLETFKKHFGEESTIVVAQLNSLGLLYWQMGRYAEAEPLYKRALEIREKALGKDHHDVATSLNNLAGLYESTGRYADAEPLYKRALEVRERVLGKEHPDVAISLHHLGLLYFSSGRYAEAEPFYKRLLEVKEKILGENHLDLTPILDSLGFIYGWTGKFHEAEIALKRSIDLKENALGKNHPDIVVSISALAELYKKTKRYAEAEMLYKRGLEIREKELGKEHSKVASSLFSLAELYKYIFRYPEAESLYKKALEIEEKASGKEHPDVAISLNNLAELYRLTGRYSEAEPLFKRSLEIREKVLGKEHPDVANSLINLAGRYISTGSYGEAEVLLKRALDICEKTLGKETPWMASGIANLANIYEYTGRYAEAESLYKRALEIWEKTFGNETPYMASTLISLAGLYYESMDRYAEAELLLKKALDLQENLLGKYHPNLTSTLNDLSRLYILTGRHTEAEPLCKRAVEIYKKSGDQSNPNFAMSLINLGFVYNLSDRYVEAHNIVNHAISLMDQKRDSIFLILSDKQKLNYMKQKEIYTHGFITHANRYMQTNPFAITNTLNAWLRWKGAVIESQGRYMDAAMYSDNPEIKKKFDELTNIRREIARLQMTKIETIELQEYRNRHQELEKQKETLEAELSTLSKDFALEKMLGKADVKKISEILPIGSIYIDFANIKIYDFKTNKFDKPKYLAFVLIPQKETEVKLIEIADAEEIEKHVRAYLQEMNKIKTLGKIPDKAALDKAARAIYDIAIKPLEKYIEGRKQLFISPDGNLNLIPFEALVTPDNKYLIEKHTINYIAAGRDIIRFTDTNIAKGDALIIADPDYDMGLTERTQVAQAINTTQTLRGSVSRDASNLSFERLPDTKQEADAIEKVLKKKFNVKNYQNRKAIEEVMFSTETPKILHLATHGYFLNDEELKGSKETRGITIKLKEGFEIRDEAINIENPMLRSGIVFSGVNASLKAGRDEGMVSAEKILGLNLKGTDLVVLSACETGVGDVKNGEGVFGLKRAFILSGAKTLVMSLWSVPSAETTELMTEFYTLISEGRSKSDALRQAKLNMMKKKSNPFYWGAFVMTGKPE